MAKGGKCYYCGTNCHSRDPRHDQYGTVDHKIPKSRIKRPFGKENLVLACLKCNRLKGDMLPEEFMQVLKSTKSKGGN